MVLGLAPGVVASLWLGIAARDDKLAAYPPNPWLTACLGLAIVALWVVANAAPRFAAALAAAARPGAIYAAVMLAGDDPPAGLRVVGHSHRPGLPGPWGRLPRHPARPEALVGPTQHRASDPEGPHPLSRSEAQEKAAGRGRVSARARRRR